MSKYEVGFFELGEFCIVAVAQTLFEAKQMQKIFMQTNPECAWQILEKFND